jgi:hypothetical protein
VTLFPGDVFCFIEGVILIKEGNAMKTGPTGSNSMEEEDSDGMDGCGDLVGGCISTNPACKQSILG